VKVNARASVDEANAAIYNRQYEVYRALYPALKDSFAALGDI
jgi:sugar (pentulose or hexulose) kinase